MARATVIRTGKNRPAAIKKHTVAPAKFRHVLRTYGLTAKQFTDLKEYVEKTEHVVGTRTHVLVG